MNSVFAGVIQGVHDLSCHDSKMCSPSVGLTFAIGYLALMVVRHMIVYVGLKHRFFKPQEDTEDSTRALNTITAAAIDLSAIIQFVAWIPFGLGFFGVANFYLFMMPMFQEFYDVVYLNFVHRRRFTGWLVKFVMQHHFLSTLGRVILAAMIYGFVPSSMRQFVFESILLFYCCSSFLIAPSAFEPFFAADNVRGRALLRLACFSLGRISHLFVVGRFAIVMAENVDLKTLIPALTISILLYSITEYHSVINGLSRLRGDWRRAARSNRAMEAAASEAVAGPA